MRRKTSLTTPMDRREWELWGVNLCKMLCNSAGGGHHGGGKIAKYGKQTGLERRPHWTVFQRIIKRGRSREKYDISGILGAQRRGGRERRTRGNSMGNSEKTEEKNQRKVYHELQQKGFEKRENNECKALGAGSRGVQESKTSRKIIAKTKKIRCSVDVRQIPCISSLGENGVAESATRNSFACKKVEAQLRTGGKTQARQGKKGGGRRVA